MPSTLNSTLLSQIKNIYDYTYILEALKVGEEVDVTVLRKDEEMELKITPGSRE